MATHTSLIQRVAVAYVLITMPLAACLLAWEGDHAIWCCTVRRKPVPERMAGLTPCPPSQTASSGLRRGSRSCRCPLPCPQRVPPRRSEPDHCLRSRAPGSAARTACWAPSSPLEAWWNLRQAILGRPSEAPCTSKRMHKATQKTESFQSADDTGCPNSCGCLLEQVLAHSQSHR